MSSARHAAWGWRLAALLLPAVAAASTDCGALLPAEHRVNLRSGNWELAFAPRPAPVRSGRALVLDIQVCGRAGQALPASMAVDADMPAHKHGMNYRPSVRALGGGRFEAQGLLLHMPGSWRLLFDWTDPQGGGIRLEHPIVVP